MGKYRIRIIAEAISSLTKNELESMLVASLFNVETEEKISDGDGTKIEIVDYELTEANPIGTEEF